ncbi:translation initiation factor eIF 4e-like domain-containing protein [Radiomyces spectabilis]|uniref:translation initiation factor eIF 4e-like domain-containing protein n=1 Tax=Radiomyces spectabilis TaxID=64574 RepID=UPI0022202E62|nr:translation initiation factor eIF 4e-like domain-containing protein [Radiomyces spectabilis]KAI8366681.1 translation initiation factor eIF 4e-like domain-containing protein [Radiomyces spectabilis]
MSHQEETRVEQPSNAAQETQGTGQNSNLDLSVKHRLQHEWTLWFDKPGKKADSESWSQNLKEIVTVDTVEDFWGVYNNITKVNKLEAGSSCNYHFFKKGIRPEWEDPANAKGGKFGIQFPKNKTGEAINTYWLYLLLALIGEQFDNADEICGAVVSVRKMFFRIALWIKDSEQTKEIEHIKQQLEQILAIPDNVQIDFVKHGEPAPKRPSVSQ